MLISYNNIIFEGGRALKQAITYCGQIAALGFFHMYFITSNLLLAAAFSVILFIFLYKKANIKVASLGVLWNVLMSLLQFFFLLIYLVVDTPWTYGILVVSFLLCEWLRLSFSKKIANLELELKEYEKQQTHINETFRVVRSERHDFLKHVAAIHFMLEKGQNIEAKTYLDELVDSYEETNLSIKGERGIVAGILHQMYQKGQALDIDIVYDLDLPLSTLPIADKDMVNLLGNLLSNSLDASSEWQQSYQEKPHLTLQFYKRSGLYILICKNKSLPIPPVILDKLYQSYGVTTKGDGHEGLGTKIILDIVKHYQGFLDFVYKNGEFTVKIKIPAIRS